MEPKIWGPPTWFFLHSLTFYYPEKPSYKDKSNYYDFFNSLQYVLPCNICRDNYKRHLKEYPISPYLDSKKSLVEWLIHIHNLVNKENNKPLLSASDVIQKYKYIYLNNKHYCYDYCQKQDELKEVSTKQNKNTRKYFFLILILAFVFLILFLIIKIYSLNQKIKNMIPKL